jgi:tetratricopeptide (TPR) repeat protein
MKAGKSFTVKKLTNPLTWMMILVIGLILNVNSFVDGFLTNSYKVGATKAFLSIDLSNLTYSDYLQDGIPDNWLVEAWDGAREKYDVSSIDPYSGKQSAVVEQTNQQGSATLMQAFEVTPGSPLQVSVYSKGDQGAIRVQFWDDMQGTWSGGIKKDINPSAEWQKIILDSNVPSGASRARVLLYAISGKAFFDASYAGIINDDTMGPNLLENADFEQDGIPENPLELWKQNVSYHLPDNSKTREESNIVFSNIVDLVESNFIDIQSRAHELGNRCAYFPEMTSFLLSYGSQFRLSGGAAAEERLYQLAISLAPNCPRPYAELANLYKSTKSFWKASNLYSKAADLSVGTILEGKYAFEAGLIEWMYTGELDRALLHLKRAEARGGWETSQWEQGAATYYLARTLEDLDRKDEAVQAYLRLIYCEKCVYHQSSAKLRLDKIQQ